MAGEGLAGGGQAARVAIYAALTYDIISATNSSPQTTEINADRRADTLMKWVHIGLAQAGLFAVIGIALDPERWPPIVGVGLATVLLYVQYVHAKNSGLAKGGPSTEDTAHADQPYREEWAGASRDQTVVSPFIAR